VPPVPAPLVPFTLAPFTLAPFTLVTALLLLAPGCRTRPVAGAPCAVQEPAPSAHVASPSEQAQIAQSARNQLARDAAAGEEARLLLARLEEIGMDDALERQIADLPAGDLLPELERRIAILLEDAESWRPLKVEQYRAALLRIFVMLGDGAEPMIPMLLRREHRKLTDARYRDRVSYAGYVGACGWVAWKYARPLLVSEDAKERRVGRTVLGSLARLKALPRAQRLRLTREVTDDHALAAWSHETDELVLAIVHLRVVDRRTFERIKRLCATADEEHRRTLCESFLREVDLSCEDAP
jgi:hypothetical protein